MLLEERLDLVQGGADVGRLQSFGSDDDEPSQRVGECQMVSGHCASTHPGRCTGTAGSAHLAGG